jgi:hypothetical protein
MGLNLTDFASVAVALVSVVACAYGQVGDARISGRLVDGSGEAVRDQALSFISTNGGRLQNVKVPTDDAGRFVFSGVKGISYEISLPLDERGSAFKGVGTVEVAEGQELALGDIVFRRSEPGKASVRFAGPLRLSAGAGSASTIAAFFVACSESLNEYCDAGTLHIVQGDGAVVDVAPEKDQVGVGTARISDDRRAIGWLVENANCCTSYPLALGLRVYRVGKPVKEFTGDGRAIFGWNFRAAGKRVAFYQSYPHGEPHGHYELRDLESGRLVEKWDDGDQKKAPVWTVGLEAE